MAPVLILTDGAIENAEEMLLLTETGNTRLTPAESQMAQLLLGQSGEHTFPLGSGQGTFRRCVVSVEAVEDGFAVTLTGQRRAGTALPQQHSVRRWSNSACRPFSAAGKTGTICFLWVQSGR